jgi:flagellar biosynthesis/type III secretory pathway chaperone
MTNKPQDTDRDGLRKIWNEKSRELQGFQSEEQTILRGTDKDGVLPQIQRRITILTNEVAILDSTIKIYDATYEASSHTEKAEDLREQWKELNQTFKSDKMTKLLDYLWSQLQQDADHKHGKGQ